MTDIKEKTLSNLNKKELYDKCTELLKIKEEYDQFKSQIDDYKSQLVVRGDYIQKLQKERDDLLNNAVEKEHPSLDDLISEHKNKLYKEKQEAEDRLNLLDKFSLVFN